MMQIDPFSFVATEQNRLYRVWTSNFVCTHLFSFSFSISVQFQCFFQFLSRLISFPDSLAVQVTQFRNSLGLTVANNEMEEHLVFFKEVYVSCIFQTTVYRRIKKVGIKMPYFLAHRTEHVALYLPHSGKA